MFNIFKIKIICAITVVVLVVAIGCTKNNVEPYQEKGFDLYVGTADSSQMVPMLPVGSTGTASFFARYDRDLHIFNYYLKWQNMSAGVTRADMFFPSTSVSNGVSVRTLFSTSTPRPALLDSIHGAILGNFELTTSELADLNAGNVYYTVTTQSNTGGEIRGKILPKK